MFPAAGREDTESKTDVLYIKRASSLPKERHGLAV